MFRIRFILIRIRILGSVLWNNGSSSGSGSCSRSDLKLRKYQLFLILFFKNIFLQKNDMFGYLWGKYLCPLNKSLIFSKKCMIFLVFFGRFLWKFSMIKAVFLLPGFLSWNGSESGWPKWNGFKQIRIRNTVYKLHIIFFLKKLKCKPSYSIFENNCIILLWCIFSINNAKCKTKYI